MNIKNRQNIIVQINNLKNRKNNLISIMYEYQIKRNNKNKNYSLWIISNKEMNKIDNKNYQYFCNATYKYIPQTFHKYKLFIISAYNLIQKNIRISCFTLIPNELEEKYQKIFGILKDNYKFNPMIITLYFFISISNVIIKNYPEYIQVKCLFHFVQALAKK